eukprot:2141616-Rhodomonas_salina.1
MLRSDGLLCVRSFVRSCLFVCLFVPLCVCAVSGEGPGGRSRSWCGCSARKPTQQVALLAREASAPAASCTARSNHHLVSPRIRRDRT